MLPELLLIQWVLGADHKDYLIAYKGDIDRPRDTKCSQVHVQGVCMFTNGESAEKLDSTLSSPTPLSVPRKIKKGFKKPYNFATTTCSTHMCLTAAEPQNRPPTRKCKLKTSNVYEKKKRVAKQKYIRLAQSYELKYKPFPGYKLSFRKHPLDLFLSHDHFQNPRAERTTLFKEFPKTSRASRFECFFLPSF